jgi:hypothetical protein
MIYRAFLVLIQYPNHRVFVELREQCDTPQPHEPGLLDFCSFDGRINKPVPTAMSATISPKSQPVKLRKPVNAKDKSLAPSFPYLTWRQLKTRYPDQWVMLINADSLPTGYAVKGGEFVGSASNQDDAFDYARHVPTGSTMSVVFTGSRELPKDVVLCL